MTPNKKELLKWIEALRSGKYKQTTGVLQDSKGYCCLGVACEVLIPNKNKKLNENRFLRGYGPNGQVSSPFWLKKINSEFSIKAGESLSNLNDVYQLSFNEIADLLELVYIHKILE